jgi:hypothetical protein
MHWPRFLSEASEMNFLIRLIQQHHTDIQRLWKRMPQTPEFTGPGGGLNIGGVVPGTSGQSAGTGQTGDTGGSVTSASAIIKYPCLAKTLSAFPVDTSAVVEVWIGEPLEEVASGKEVRVCNRFNDIDADSFIWLEKDSNTGHVYVTSARCNA